MHANALAASAYSQTSRQAAPPRAVEHSAFQRVTGLLRAASKPDAPFSAMAEAVHLNNKLWTILATDLASPSNGLPTELRAQLFGLAEFSRKEGMRALSGQGSVEELIEINSAIMSGLRGVAGPATQAEVPPSEPGQPALAEAGA